MIPAWLAGINPRMILYGAMAAAVLGFGASWYHRGVQVERLEGRVGVLTQELQVAHAAAEQAADAARVLTARLRAAETSRNNIEVIRREANRAPASSDAPVAPVLRDALVGLGRLRQPSASAPPSP